jgi:hypothetical protein
MIFKSYSVCKKNARTIWKIPPCFEVPQYNSRKILTGYQRYLSYRLMLTSIGFSVYLIGVACKQYKSIQ